jgi:tRNA-binding protein
LQARGTDAGGKEKGMLENKAAAGPITFDDFLKVDMRVGRIVEVSEFPEARKPAYKLVIDFGAEIGTRKSSAQITKLYGTDELQGRMIIGVVNFPPKQIGPWRSEVLVLGTEIGEGEIALLAPAPNAAIGSRVF